MSVFDAITAACGVLIDPKDGFSHLATAWQVAPGEWLTAWDDEDPPGPGLCLISAHFGEVAAITDWEQEAGIAGFRCLAVESSLSVASAAAGLAKRSPLLAVGYPSLIDHPAFALHRGSLDPERYFPYLCPWLIEGHLALFTAEEGYLAGRSYSGMAGGPVCNVDGAVVGMIAAPSVDSAHVPLTHFRRLGSDN